MNDRLKHTSRASDLDGPNARAGALAADGAALARGPESYGDASRSESPKAADGMCACGCGERAQLAPRTNREAGMVKGEPMRYAKGHRRRAMARRAHSDGYVLVHSPGHPRGHNGYVYEHILVAEKALGRMLSARAQVHHVDHDRKNNAGGNLVICEDRSYHALLHRRERALFASGDPSAISCLFCGRYDRQAEMWFNRTRTKAAHRTCNAAHQRERKARARAGAST